MARLAAALRRDPSEVRLATIDEVARRFPNCEPGALPPFGRMYGISTVLDASLAAQSEIAFAGHTRHEGLRMRFADFEAVESPIRAEFAAPICPAPAPSPRPHRRAG